MKKSYIILLICMTCLVGCGKTSSIASAEAMDVVSDDVTQNEEELYTLEGYINGLVEEIEPDDKIAPTSMKSSDENEAEKVKYEVVIDKTDWQSAFDAASAKGGSLLNINSYEEYEEINKLLSDYYNTDTLFWIGGMLDKLEREYYWTDANGQMGKDVINAGDSIMWWGKNDPDFYNHEYDWLELNNNGLALSFSDENYNFVISDYDQRECFGYIIEYGDDDTEIHDNNRIMEGKIKYGNIICNWSDTTIKERLNKEELLALVKKYDETEEPRFSFIFLDNDDYPELLVEGICNDQEYETYYDIYYLESGKPQIIRLIGSDNNLGLSIDGHHSLVGSGYDGARLYMVEKAGLLLTSYSPSEDVYYQGYEYNLNGKKYGDKNIEYVYKHEMVMHTEYISYTNKSGGKNENEYTIMVENSKLDMIDSYLDSFDDYKKANEILDHCYGFENLPESDEIAEMLGVDKLSAMVYLSRGDMDYSGMLKFVNEL